MLITGIINYVILQCAVYLGHRNQTEQFVLINDSKILYKAPFGIFMNNHTSITSLYKTNPPTPTPPSKSQDVCILLVQEDGFL